MWVRFTTDFDWKPTPQSTTAYKAGMVMNVTRACAEAALQASKAVKAAKTRREDEDGVEA
ncbi:hypothetical protein [Mesorhizobium muleiense]|uniref:hypothetical protein n=1 Tax=Mesorhizobium muleiense TaxID=1004279 RepID=UPI001F46D326|nr:hypothetical protein [Mesorhizobium muleiense]MCF6111996.1 hypothetical protein [Mesorhizobium muleiense]